MTTESTTSSIGQCAPLTALGRGAVATIRVRGDWSRIDSVEPPLFKAVSHRQIAEFAIGRMIYGLWGQDAQEDVVVCRLTAESIEIHCHGGSAAIQRILTDLVSRGFTVCESWELEDRARDTLDREVLQTVTACRTLQTASLAHRQADGRMHTAIQTLLNDRPDHESDQGAWLKSVTVLTDNVLEWSELGRHLATPWKVVVAGRPNVGKSSLINAIVGFERSVVFDQPGTTRDVLSASTVLEGWPIEFFDTAGIRQTYEVIERTGIERAMVAVDDADEIILVLDRSEPLTDDDSELLQQFPNAILAANKCDLAAKWNDESGRAVLEVSAANDTGIEALNSQLVKRLIPEMPGESEIVPVSDRQVSLLRAIHDASQSGDASQTFQLMQSFLN